MKRLAKKFMTGVLTASMAAGVMAVPAFAEGLDAEISVTGVVSGDTAAYYQILKQNATTGEWELTDAMKNVTVNGNNLKAEDITNGVDASELHAITAALSGAGTAMTEDGTTLKADNVDAGTYVVIITPGSANNSGFVYNPVVVSADYDSANTSNTAEAKKTDVTVKKTADEAKKDVNAGDTISFKVEPVVPIFPKNYTNPVYKVADTLSTGLEISDLDGDGEYADEITITGVDSTDYIITATKAGFTVEFTSAYLKGLAAAPTVEITYNAVVTSDADYSVNRMTNTAKINFSNAPDDVTGNGTYEDKTNHYTFTIDGELGGEYAAEEKAVSKELVKIAVDQNGNPILDTANEHEYTIAGPSKKTASPLAGATFKLTGGSLGANGMTAQSGTDGSITFEGLDAGTYTLKEISAPTGYVVDNEEHSVVIAAQYKTGTDELESYTITIDDTVTSSFKVSNTGESAVTIVKTDTTILTSLLSNVKATGLPSTGGAGTTMFYVIGIILAAGAAVLLVTKRRMNTK